MNKIIVTTDASDLGQEALAHARTLARALNAALTVLSVLPDPVSPVLGEFAYLPVVTPDESAAQEAELRARLERDVPAGAPGVAETLRIERAAGRSVARAITEVAEAEGAALIVMSSHGRSGLSRALLGSVAEAVAHHSAVPVLLIRHGMTPATWTGD